jgi:hypothetical protein
MIKTLSHLFTPQPSNNYKAKTLHLSSLSLFILIIMFSQILISFVGRTLPGVLGIASNITAQELVQLTNIQRQENGLSQLNLNSTLSQSAQLKGADMLAKNYWAHTAPDGRTPWSFFTQAGYSYAYAGENLARDFMDPGSVVNAWMNSPTHRDNILSGRFNEIGIAVVHGTFQGQDTTLIVQHFGTPVKAAVPAKIGQITEAAEAIFTQVSPQEEVAGSKYQLPWLNTFELTKTMSIGLTVLLLGVIVIDTVIITKKRIVRLSGHGLAHLVFLGILLILLLGIQPGLIL